MADNEGVEIKHQEYLFAYFVTLGKDKSESYLLASGTIDNAPRIKAQMTGEKRRKTAPKSTTTRGASGAVIWAKKPQVLWILGKLQMSVVDDVKNFLKRNKLAEEIITKDIKSELSGEISNLSADEIQTFLTLAIRALNQDGSNASTEAIVKIVPILKLYMDRFAPVNNAQDMIDRVLIEVYEPSNGICQWCNREITIDNEHVLKLVKKVFSEMNNNGLIPDNVFYDVSDYLNNLNNKGGN